MGVDIPVRLKLFSEPATCAAVEGDHSGGLVVEVFDDSDKVGTDILLPYGYLQRSMLNPVKGFLEVYEDMVKVLLVLEIFLTKDSPIKQIFTLRKTHTSLRSYSDMWPGLILTNL